MASAWMPFLFWPTIATIRQPVHGSILDAKQVCRAEHLVGYLLVYWWTQSWASKLSGSQRRWTWLLTRFLGYMAWMASTTTRNYSLITLSCPTVVNFSHQIPYLRWSGTRYSTAAWKIPWQSQSWNRLLSALSFLWIPKSIRPVGQVFDQ